MKFKYIKSGIILLILSAVFFTTCKTRDLRTSQLKKQGMTIENTAKGKAILEEALKAMNHSEFAKHTTYEIIGSDTWYKQLGMNLSPWPGQNGAILRSRYATNTFDSQTEWLDGKNKGKVIGIQSWQLYEKNGLNNQFEKIKKNEKVKFIVPTMHYFNELLFRLYNAPIVAYAGEVYENNKNYDIIFTTWDSADPNQHDQYLLYINKENNRLEKTSYTIRDNYTFTPRSFYGTAVYSDFRVVDSVTVPFQMDVFPFGQTKKMKVHTYKIKEWRFSNFPLSDLYPFKDLGSMGDAK